MKSMISCRLKHIFIIITLVFAIVAYIVYLSRLEVCDIPLPIQRLYSLPKRFHRSRCPISKRNMSIDPQVISPDNDKTVPRYLELGPLLGRIGNLMFQTASLYGIAAKLKYNVHIDPSHPLLTYFEMNSSVRMNLRNKIVLTEEGCMDAIWRCRNDILSHNITVVGYLQSWKYFAHIDQTIRKHFTIKTIFKDEAKSFLDSAKVKNRTTIGIHVRRNDFGNVYFNKCGYAMSSAYYFHNAMNLFRVDYKNVVFVIISDDIQWCKENIDADDVIYSNFSEPITALALMSMCDHMIVSGGTFGFWGAWLAGGKVIYPKDWPRPGSWLDLYGMVVEDFWLPEWIAI